MQFAYLSHDLVILKESGYVVVMDATILGSFCRLTVGAVRHFSITLCLFSFTILAFVGRPIILILRP